MAEIIENCTGDLLEAKGGQCRAKGNLSKGSLCKFQLGRTEGKDLLGSGMGDVMWSVGHAVVFGILFINTTICSVFDSSTLPN